MTTSHTTSRRQILRGAAAGAIGLSLAPLVRGADAPAPKRILYFTKSSQQQHSVVTRIKGQPSFSEKLLTGWCEDNNYEITCSKDGSLFSAEYLEKFDALVFFTSGDLTQEGTDKQPPMTAEGKEALLKAIEDGKGFIGLHSAVSTFRSPEPKKEDTHTVLDPYIAMLGGEFGTDEAQQSSKIKMVDDKFPGLQKQKDFETVDEWIVLKNFSPDIHVIGVQDPKGMSGAVYNTPNYPETWARNHGKGRVFYTSMGHREDLWKRPLFQKFVLAALAWTTGRTNAEIPANIKQVCPEITPVTPA